jgi:methyl-accepting chemotaxis protein
MQLFYFLFSSLQCTTTSQVSDELTKTANALEKISSQIDDGAAQAKLTADKITAALQVFVFLFLYLFLST